MNDNSREYIENIPGEPLLMFCNWNVNTFPQVLENLIGEYIGAQSTCSEKLDSRKQSWTDEVNEMAARINAQT